MKKPHFLCITPYEGMREIFRNIAAIRSDFTCTILLGDYEQGDSPEEQARELFDVLRHVDDEKMELAFVRFPSLDGVGMAVYNRLLRAAGFEVIEL